MQLNPAEISELLKSKISNLKIAADTRNQGTVVTLQRASYRIEADLLGARTLPALKESPRKLRRTDERYDLLVDIAGTRSWSACKRVLKPSANVVVVGGPRNSSLLGPRPAITAVAMGET